MKDRLVREFAAYAGGECTCGGVSMVPGKVTAVNTGDSTVDVRVEDATTGTVWPHLRRSTGYTPVVNDRVVVLFQKPGGGQRGGWAVVAFKTT